MSSFVSAFYTLFIFCSFFFFFSSRRRHTRCSRDWSSDVCSSDLAAALALARIGKEAKAAVPALLDVTKADDPLSAVYALGALALLDDKPDGQDRKSVV